MASREQAIFSSAEYSRAAAMVEEDRVPSEQ
jgi:hypothetical protein